MVLILGLALAGLVGFAVGRWWVLGVGPLAGSAAAANAVVSGTSLGDTPALFLAAFVTAASLFGMVLRRRLRQRTT
ncbi:MAG: hypothetical protein DLM67_15985 [Candidatus Nephthysia bennettiae]|nr:hypothetical protein [Candidatus Dormibacteraeota bacterium]PZR91596.1 MAG: hypothetical protein DLM67_15985 [Candidatus Dormibacteraeota bacterium]